MRRHLFACVVLALSFAVPVASPTPAHAVTVEINVGTSLNNGRAIPELDAADRRRAAIGSWAQWWGQ